MFFQKKGKKSTLIFQRFCLATLVILFLLTAYNSIFLNKTNPRGTGLLDLFIQPVQADSLPAGDRDEYGLNETANQAGLYSKTKSQTDLATIIGLVIKSLLSFLGVLFLVLIIYGGFLWMTGSKGGEKKDINKAKTIIINATIGLVIVLAAYAITNFVMDSITSAVKRP